MLINFTRGTGPTCTYGQIFQGGCPRPDLILNHIVVVGAKVIDAGDVYSQPVDFVHNASFCPEFRPRCMLDNQNYGYRIQADAMSTILQDRYVQVQPDASTKLVILLLGMLVGLIVYLLPFRLGMILTASILGAYFAGIYGLGRLGYLSDPLYAPLAIVFARVAELGDRRGPKPPSTHAGITAFAVPLDAPGVVVGPAERKLGLKASDTSALVLDGVRVSRDAVIGEVGKGFALALAALDGGRIGIAAQSVGIARAAIALARAYAKQRKQFGRPIADFDGVRFPLARSESEVAAARLLALRAAWLKDHGRPFTREAAMAKLYASEMAQRATHTAVQTLGGYGYLREYAVERYARDGRATTIYEGTSEIQRLVIARSLLAA